uniref:Uncharacterized protein n=1 Tax=Panagrolaimus davidi TaxID=227884 RepID=A0A914PER8_9BILA
MTNLTSNIRRAVTQAANSLGAENRAAENLVLNLNFADKIDINVIKDKLTDLEYDQSRKTNKSSMKKT